MRFLLLVFSMFFMSISFNSLLNGDTAPELSPECIEQGKVRDELFNQEIMEDIIDSFRLDIDDSYHKFTLKDLDAAQLLYGGREDDSYYNSLSSLFMDIDVSTRGTPRLFVRPRNAYFLYKEAVNNTNVMMHLELKNKRWVVVEERSTPGNVIAYEHLKCEKDYMKKRNKYHN